MDQRRDPRIEKVRDWRHNDRPGRAWAAEPLPARRSGQAAA